MSENVEVVKKPTKTERLNDLATLTSLCKRRGFIFPSSEIYGGINSCWDYGPLGAELKNNLKRIWWEAMVRRHDIVGLDASILMAPQVWKASGHVDNFTDPLVDCKKCKSRFRQDQIPAGTKGCPNCGGELSEARNFNLMFKTFMGPVEESAAVVYLRPETAQGIYVNFENVQVSMRRKIPFGIAQIGKAFRNEITPGNFIFRTREFEQMEMQYFVKPGTDEEVMQRWKDERMKFYLKYGIRKENLQFHQHGPKELAHYAKSAFDIQYKFPIGWQEIEGIHNRTDFDLKNHQQLSGKNLEYFEEATKEKYIPYIIETSAGCDRNVLTFMCDAYRVEAVEGEAADDARVVLGFHPELAPIKVAILPLSKKEHLMEYSDKVRDALGKHWMVQSDEAGSIGKRYRRQDEVGTPLCVTVDFQSLEDHKVTVRHRDTMKQDRVDVSQLEAYVKNKLANFNE
ncbi:MAG TPA: glycine--tRNA ligase [Bdellovibrionales bacterium]|nr:glycine--tRNA ligase [Bdellovibrionales bacterium]